jgi:hypothetical protein
MAIPPMASTPDQTSENSHLSPGNDTDYLFLAFLAFIVACVTWLGVINYKEALKTEDAKANGEAWVAWLTETGTTRFDADTKHPACKGGVKPTGNAKSDQPEAGTWGACLAYILEKTELKDLNNSFFNEPPKFVPACVTTDRTLMGAIVLEDLMPTPPGSATPFVASELIAADPIDYKMQLRLSVCDKGGLAIKVAEFEF